MIKTLTIFGTRPEAIKLAPLIKKLSHDANFESLVCTTGQHKNMLDSVLNIFDITPDFSLNIMKSNQSLSEITSSILTKLDSIIKKVNPDIIFVHGDTSTTFAAALSAYYHNKQVAHVEAGLRTGNIYSPWPEEANRKLTASITNYHFAPTQLAQKNLLKENIDKNQIYITGNTVIDSLKLIQENYFKEENNIKHLEKSFSFLNKKKKLILVTGHRRESFGKGFENICIALKKIASEIKDVEIVYPVHLNPNVKKPVNKILSKVPNIYLLEPQEYISFIYLMTRSYMIITDSGGIQEEAPSLGKPVLVLRETTERPEALEAGTVKLVGTDVDKIYKNTLKLVNDERVYKDMSQSHNPYGDGYACEKILDALKGSFKG